MCRLHSQRRLVRVSLGLAAALIAGGCGADSSIDNNVKPGSGVALNPGGKVSGAAAERAAKMQQMGNQMNADQMKAAQEMAAAKARTGGK